MERYKTVEEFLNDYIFNIDKDNKLLPKLQKLATRAMCYGKQEIKVHELGYISVNVRLSGLYQSEKKLLSSWRDTAVQWKDNHNTVWSIYYEPSKYIGKPDIIRVSKEYFYNK